MKNKKLIEEIDDLKDKVGYYIDKDKVNTTFKSREEKKTEYINAKKEYKDAKEKFSNLYGVKRLKINKRTALCLMFLPLVISGTITSAISFGIPELCFGKEENAYNIYTYNSNTESSFLEGVYDSDLYDKHASFYSVSPWIKNEDTNLYEQQIKIYTDEDIKDKKNLENITNLGYYAFIKYADQNFSSSDDSKNFKTTNYKDTLTKEEQDFNGFIEAKYAEENEEIKRPLSEETRKSKNDTIRTLAITMGIVITMGSYAIAYLIEEMDLGDLIYNLKVNKHIKEEYPGKINEIKLKKEKYKTLKKELKK